MNTTVVKPTQSFINMLISLGGLAIVIGGLIYSNAQTTAKFELQTQQWVEFQKQQQSWNVSLETDRRAARIGYEQQMRDLLAVIAKQSAASDQVTMQVGMLQKSDENTDARINRITDNYGERFDALQAAINELKTEQALTKQTVTEIKILLQQQGARGPR